MLKYANYRILKVVLDLYNKIWVEGRMPRSWKHAIIIPIAKPGKYASIAGNYRPIALTSNLCKLIEKVIVNRLNYVLESKGALAPNQYGFRKGRSTLDALVKLETDVKKSIAVKEGLVAVYFDMEKAYDMLWKEGLLIKMKRIGLEGRMGFKFFISESESESALFAKCAQTHKEFVVVFKKLLVHTVHAYIHIYIHI